MSTVINAADGTPAAVLRRQDDAHLLVGCGPVGSHALPHVSRQASVPRADFLAAVAKECGVVVIDRAELPEVIQSNGVVHTARASGVATAENAQAWREDARHSLALAEYLDAHPPVDEAQVEALFTVLNESTSNTAETNRVLARRLVREGWKR